MAIKLVLGTMTFGGQADADTSSAMINTFREAGHTELDSAYKYNNGDTEILLGNLSEQFSFDNFSVATKVAPIADGGLSPASIDRQFMLSLERMKRESVDLLYLHAPDLNVPITDTLAALDKHFQAGRFLKLGLSNYAAWQVAEIVELSRANGWQVPVVYQGMYNALTRDVERELFNCLTNFNIDFYIYNPLAGGMLTGKHAGIEALPDTGRFATYDGYQERYWKSIYFNVINDFKQACNEHSIAPAEAAIRWLLHHSALANQDDRNHGIILGASKLAQLKENLQFASAGPLPDSIVESLDNGWERVRPDCIKYFRP